MGWGFCKMANELQLNKINNNTQVRITKAKVAKINEILWYSLFKMNIFINLCKISHNFISGDFVECSFCRVGLLSARAFVAFPLKAFRHMVHIMKKSLRNWTLYSTIRKWIWISTFNFFKAMLHYFRMKHNIYKNEKLLGIIA